MPTRPAGFTLIELIVSVAILSIVSAIGIAGFISFQDNQKVLSAAKEVQQLYVDAQVKARVKETPGSCTNPLQSYVVKYTSSSRKFSLHARCPGEQAERDYAIITDSSISMNNVPASVEFPTQYGDTGRSGDLTMCFTNGSDMYQFSITKNGQVGDVEKATACP